ncbi:hypothetical protein EDD86DRAFT_211917 [Gorgonomyces haynaldii]|nr:hypothetical protein EDD86DRAFT_211917 [Gorgonomyces haynaldii]
MQPKQQKLIFIGLFLVIFITAVIQVAGIADQGQFGPSRRCLLYVTNYHKEGKTYLFDSTAHACSTVVSAGTIGIFLLAGVIGTHLFYLYKKEENPPPQVTKAFFIGACVWSFVSLVVAGMVSGGIAQMCSEFQKNEEHKSCGAVLGDGFFEGDFSGKGKNVNTIYAAASAGWVVMFGWIAIAFLEKKLQNTAAMWWTSI